MLACQTCEELIAWEKGNRAGGKDVAVSRELIGMDNLLLQLFVMSANGENINVLIVKFVVQPVFLRITFKHQGSFGFLHPMACIPILWRGFVSKPEFVA